MEILKQGGKNYVIFEDDELPIGRELENSCGHATLRQTASDFGQKISERLIALITGVPQGEGMDEEFAAGIEALGLLHSGWLQTTLDLCGQVLQLVPEADVIVNYMDGPDDEKNDNNHYAHLGAVNETHVVIRDTQISGSISIQRRIDFEARWHHVDDTVPSSEREHQALIVAKQRQDLAAAMAILGIPASLPSQIQSAVH